MKRRIFQSLAVLAIVIDVAIIGYGAYLYLYPFRTLVQTGPITIKGSPAPGQPILYSFPYCKYIDDNSDSVKTLIGTGTNYALPTQQGSLPIGCGVAKGNSTYVPVGVRPGRYHLDFAVSYQVNPLRRITVRFSSQEFTVSAASGAVSVALPTPVIESLTITPSVAPAGSGRAKTIVTTTPSPSYNPPATPFILHPGPTISPLSQAIDTILGIGL